MAKYYGKIGFLVEDEVKPGIWVKQPIEKNYYGDVYRMSKLLAQRHEINDGINVNNQISIVADPFANNNLENILYVTFLNSKWKITNVDVQYPRLILTLGGVYNEQPTKTS